MRGPGKGMSWGALRPRHGTGVLEIVKKKRHLRIWVLLKEVPGMQQLPPEQNSSCSHFLESWLQSQKHPGLLSQTSRSRACRPSTRGLREGFSWVASFSLNHKTARYKFFRKKSTWGFQRWDQQQVGKSHQHLGPRRGPGVEQVFLHP